MYVYKISKYFLKANVFNKFNEDMELDSCIFLRESQKDV